MADFNPSDFSGLQSLQGLLSFSPNEEEQRKALTYGLIGAGLGILSANGSTPRGAGAGYAIGTGGLPGFQAYTQTLENAPKQRLQNVQSMMQIAGLKKTLDAQDMLKDFVKGGGPISGASPYGQAQNALTQGAAQGDPTNTNAARIPQAPQGRAIPNFSMLLAAGVPGETVKAMMEHYKMTEPDMQVSNGYAYDKRNIQPGFLPGMQIARNGQAALTTIGPNGMPIVSAPQGALDTYGAYEEAEKRAAAKYDLQTRPPLSPNSPPTYASRLDLLNGAQPTPYNAVPQPQGQVLRSTAPSREEAIRQGQEAMARGENFSISVPPSRPMGIPAERVIPNAAGMSPAVQEGFKTDVERQRGINTANTDVSKQSVERLTKEADAQRGILNTLSTVEGILGRPEGVYGNNPLDRAAMLAHTQGLQSPKSINTQRVRELGSQLVLARGSLGTAVSNKDAETYAKAAGDFQNAKSVADMVDSIKVMREIASRAFEQTNQSMQTFQQTGNLPTYAIPSTDQMIREQRGTAPDRRQNVQRSNTSRIVDFGSLR